MCVCMVCMVWVGGCVWMYVCHRYRLVIWNMIINIVGKVISPLLITNYYMQHVCMTYVCCSAMECRITHVVCSTMYIVRSVSYTHVDCRATIVSLIHNACDYRLTEVVNSVFVDYSDDITHKS